MNARQLVPIAILVAAASVAAASDLDRDTKTVEGEVLMLTPAVLQLASDQGVIEAFEITPDSEIDDQVVRGDWVTVWYRDTGDSKVVVRSEPPAQGRTEAGAASRGGQEVTGTTGSEREAGMGVESDSQQGQTATGETSWYDREGEPYPEAVNPPDNAIIGGRRGAMMLPDTASALPTAGLLGLAALAAATAVGMLRRRI
ncbi:MAG TPA: hypothetical protein VLB51_03940 [Methylomirabilota bacterium]|nr:hypothetical protein [Methylomirabilota bacterium]